MDGECLRVFGERALQEPCTSETSGVKPVILEDSLVSCKQRSKGKQAVTRASTVEHFPPISRSCVAACDLGSDSCAHGSNRCIDRSAIKARSRLPLALERDVVLQKNMLGVTLGGSREALEREAAKEKKKHKKVSGLALAWSAQVCRLAPGRKKQTQSFFSLSHAHSSSSPPHTTGAPQEAQEGAAAQGQGAQQPGRQLWRRLVGGGRRRRRRRRR